MEPKSPIRLESPAAMAEPSNRVVLPVRSTSPAPTEIDSGSASDSAHDDQEMGDPFMIGDDFMNGSCMPGMTDSQELAVARALEPPRVVWAITDVLAVDAQSRRHDPAQSSSRRRCVGSRRNDAPGVGVLGPTRC